MNLNQEQLRALAESCHIGLTGEECEALVGELNELLAMPCLSREAALSNSGRTCEGCFAVPRTVESVS